MSPNLRILFFSTSKGRGICETQFRESCVCVCVHVGLCVHVGMCVQRYIFDWMMLRQGNMNVVGQRL